MENANAKPVDNTQVEYLEDDLKANVINNPNLKHTQPAIYQEAVDRYPTDESIDEADERKLVRKIDRRILPLLGICYFFYVRQSFVATIVEHLTNLTVVCR